ncbi:MAG: YybS family protein [Nitrospinae bacterium]|nr:YybS family protein [Nitrospinota bacterium]
MAESPAEEPQRRRVELGRLAAPLLSAVLFLSIFYVPVLGVVLNLFAPLPLIYSSLRFGEGAGAGAALFSALVVAAGSDPRTAAFYFLSYALMALVMSRLMSRQSGLNAAAGYGAGVSMAATAVFLYFALGMASGGGGYYDELVKSAQTVIAEMISAYKKAGMQEEQLAILSKNSPLIAKWSVSLIPGMAVSGYLLMAFCNYLSYKFLRSRWPGLKAPDDVSLLNWYPPDRTVFVFIAGMALALLPNDAARVAGINVLVVTVLVYSVAGSCVLRFWFEKIRFPKFLRMFSYILILLQPFIAVAVAAMGLFDLWFDFRKIRRQAGVKEE